MKGKNLKLPIILVLLQFFFSAYPKNPLVLMKTSEGNMKIELYEDTPMHTDNFLELVEKGFYNGLLFHRVIEGFMVQTGDPDSKNALPGTRLGYGGPKYTVPQEFRKQYYHKKGALSAARQPDNINPSKSSSATQFYIVQGQVLNDEILQKYINAKAHIPFTEQQKKDYKTIGGTPHLDYNYTVFGQVLEGLNVIDSIAKYETDKYDRPLKDIKILNIQIISK